MHPCVECSGQIIGYHWWGGASHPNPTTPAHRGPGHTQKEFNVQRASNERHACASCIHVLSVRDRSSYIIGGEGRHTPTPPLPRIGVQGAAPSRAVPAGRAARGPARPAARAGVPRPSRSPRCHGQRVRRPPACARVAWRGVPGEPRRGVAPGRAQHRGAPGRAGGSRARRASAAQPLAPAAGSSRLPTTREPGGLGGPAGTES
eukprot:scaffold4951_cov106-Isochrysis_galbana.AAC.2